MPVGTVDSTYVGEAVGLGVPPRLAELCARMHLKRDTPASREVMSIAKIEGRTNWVFNLECNRKIGRSGRI